MLVGLAGWVPAFAQMRPFDIPAGEAEKSIPEVARQSGMPIVGPGEVLRGVTTPQVKGVFDVVDVLKLMLKGTGLTISRSAEAVITVALPSPKRACNDEGETMRNQTKLAATASWFAMMMAAIQCAAAQPTDGDMATETVVVTGLRASLGQALDTKKDATTIVDSIVAVDVGKFPDDDVVQSLARIPGVQISRKYGEGAGVMIHGLSQTKAVLNGREVITGSGGGGFTGRNLNLSDLSSDVIGAINVYKGSTADQIEGGLGGYIDVRTHRPFDFDGFKLTGAIKGQYFNRVRDLGPAGTFSYSALASDRWDTKIGEMGLMLNISHSDVVETQDRQGAEEYGPMSNFAGSGQVVYMPTFFFFNGSQWGTHSRDSIIGIYEWRPTKNLRLYAEAYDWDSKSYVNFADMRVNLRSPTSTGNYTLFPGTHDLAQGDFTNVGLQQTATYAPTENLSQQYVLGAEYATGNLVVKAEVSRTGARNIGNLYEWEMDGTAPLATVSKSARGDYAMNLHGFNPADPANYKPFDFLSLVGGGHVKDLVANVDAEYSLGWGILDKISAGVRFGQYGAVSDGANATNWNCCFTSNSSATLPANFLEVYPSSAGNFVSFNMGKVMQDHDLRKYFNQPLRYPPDDAYYLQGVENTYAAYGRLDYAIALPADMLIDGNIGGRFIATNSHSSSYGTDPANPTGPSVLQTAGSNRQDFLPSVNARWKIVDGLQLRADVNKSMQRITIDQLSGAVIVTNAQQRQGKRGNPDLQPMMSWNYDLSLEYYFSNTGLVYVAGFRKQVSGFTAGMTLTGQTVPGWSGNDWRISTVTNLNSSKVQGYEVGVQTFFDFLPEPFDGLGVQANYTNIDGTTKDYTSGALKTYPLPGVPKSAYNLIGMYEKGPYSLRLAYTWTDKTATTYYDNDAPDIVAAYGVLDLQAGYNITDKATVSFTAGNILNYHSTSISHSRPTNISGNYETASRYGIQLKYDFY